MILTFLNRFAKNCWPRVHIIYFVHSSTVQVGRTDVTLLSQNTQLNKQQENSLLNNQPRRAAVSRKKAFREGKYRPLVDKYNHTVVRCMWICQYVLFFCHLVGNLKYCIAH